MDEEDTKRKNRELSKHRSENTKLKLLNDKFKMELAEQGVGYTYNVPFN